MGIVEIIGGVLLILVSLVIIVTVTLQESKGGLGALGVESGDSFFDRNSRGRTKDAMLVRATKIAGAALFIITLAVFAAGVYL
jgi:protein translocase SecG subunit